MPDNNFKPMKKKATADAYNSAMSSFPAKNQKIKELSTKLQLAGKKEEIIRGQNNRISR